MLDDIVTSVTLATSSSASTINGITIHLTHAVPVEFLARVKLLDGRRLSHEGYV